MRGRSAVLCALGVVVTLFVASTLMQSVLAAKNKTKVLDCHITEAVAHHHDSSCYDESGELVCTLPERELHTHDASCYERRLTCTIPEGEDAHKHTDGCYDADGNLTCTLEESDGHQHSDDCYEDELICDKEELTEEHVHGDGCFHMVAADDDADETIQPDQTFSEALKDDEGKLVVAVDVAAPEGALPEGATMQASLVKEDELDSDMLQKAIDTEAAKLDTLESGKLLDMKGVDISFRDAEGKTIEPDKDVTVRLTCDLAKSEDPSLVLRVDEESGSEPASATELATTAALDSDSDSDAATASAGELRVAGESGAATDSDAATASAGELRVAGESGAATDPAVGPRTFTKAERVDTLSKKQALRKGSKLGDDQLAFEASHSGTFVLADVSAHATMTSEDVATATVTLHAPAKAGIPANATLAVKEIARSEKDYDGYVDASVEATHLEKDDLGLARFFDITILDAEGAEVQPQAPVDVEIKLADVPEDAEDFKLVHFAGEDETPEELEAGGEGGTTTFTAESFSVYGVIYTVDFGYQVGDKVFEFSIKGGDSLSMRELADKLHIHENVLGCDSAEDFVEAIDKVEFSDPELIYVAKVDGKKTQREIMDEQKLDVEFSADLTDDETQKILAKRYEDEWVLLSVKAFDTTEKLTITMKDGSQQIVKITDDQPPKANHKDPQTGTVAVDTIANPGSTTIDLFDYWITSESHSFMGDWPGHAHDDENYNFPNWVHNRPGGGGNSVRGGGHWQGINWNGQYQGGQDFGPNTGSHPLKFVPAADGTVWDNRGTRNKDNNRDINSYTGNATPVQGIVDSNLSQGYPRLTNNLGGNGESLAYLFDHSAQNGKKVYPNVSHLLYVDEDDGFYTYDSNLVQARYDDSTKTFRESFHGNYGGGDTGRKKRGFWPFGYGKWHFGMHVSTQFVQPEDGVVPNKEGTTMIPMEFKFAGDDDAWVFIDGKLVGDAGGIHNGTVIHIDFKSGDVLVTAKEDKNNHAVGWDRTTSLGQIFGGSADMDGNTFKAGTHHTFDFFYLERGGSESNLLLKYNLLSTTDFEAMKHYQTDDGTFLKKDQFRFMLIGVDGRFDKSGNIVSGTDDEKAIMPTAPDLGWVPGTGDKVPEGSADKPSLMDLDDYPEDTGVEDPTTHKPITRPMDLQIYTTGNQADGRVLFGKATIPENIKAAYDANPSAPPRYRYIVMEQIPPTAHNAAGKMWADATVQERRAGGFFDGSVVYDNQIYYMECTVAKKPVENSDGTPRLGPDNKPIYDYVLDRAYYTDANFDTKLDDQDIALEFTNRNVKPVSLVITKQNNTDDTDKVVTLSGAEFEMTPAEKVSDSPEKYRVPQGATGLTVTTGADGTASFPALPPGTYLLRETKAPANYQLADKQWLVDFTMAKAPNPHIEPVITELTADGEVPANPTIIRPQTSDASAADPTTRETIQIKTAPLTIKNDELAAYKLKVQKQWEGIEGTDAALKDSTVQLRLGRYKLEEKQGTLNIVKTGVPHGSDVIINYVVEKITPDYKNHRVASWFVTDWPASGTYSISLPVDAADDAYGTQYVVYEKVIREDGAYTVVHNDGIVNPQYVAVSKNASGTANFTATYTKQAAHLFLKTTLDKGGYTVDTSGVTYTLYDDKDNVLGSWSYDSVVGDAAYDSAAGLDLGEFLPGRYTIVESGWPAVADSEVDRSPEPWPNGTSSSVVKLVQGGSATAEFATSYHERIPVEVQVFFYQKGDFDSVPATPNKTFTVYGSRAQLAISAVPGDTDYTDDTRYKRDDHVIVGESYGARSYDIQWDSYTDGGALTRGTIDVGLPGRESGQMTREPLKIYIGTDEADYSAFDATGCTEIAATSLAGANAGVGASAQSESKQTGGKQDGRSGGATNAASSGRGAKRGASKDAAASSQGASKAASLLGAAGGFTPTSSHIKAGHVAIPEGADQDPDLFLLWDGEGRPQAGAGKAYIDDTDFNDQKHTIEMTQADADTVVTAATWEKVVEDGDTYPAYDENGNAYLYYVVGVRETEMPRGTECTIVKDGDKQLVSRYVDEDSDPVALAVKNKVGRPIDVELIKVDKDDPTKTLAGAKFHVEHQNEDSKQWERLKGDAAPAVKTIGTGIDVSLDGNGVFEVPATGVVVKELEPGQYRFVEDACPTGYTMDQTEYAFAVEEDGTITSAYKAEDKDACITLNIPNPPGTELPHAGGVGTTLIYAMGCALMAAGALMTLRRRASER